MPCFTKPLTNPLSMAATTNSCLLSLPPFFTKNTLCCSYPLKAISAISLTSSFTLFPSSLSIKKTNTQFPNFVFAAQQDDDNNTLVLEEEQEQEQVQDEELIILDDFEGGGVDEAEAGVDEAEAEQEQGQDEELIILDDFEGGVDDEAEAGVDEAEAEAEQEQGQDEELIISDDFEGGVVDEAEAEAEAEAAEEYQEPPEDSKLYVGNLPYEFDSEQLAQLFQEAGVVEIAEIIYSRETDKSRGFGFVTMSTVEEAEKAVRLYNRYDLNGRLLTVNRSAPRGSRPERPPRTFQPTSSIYVGNLPWDIDDARLEQVFSEHGKVVSARIVYDRVSGRSRGFGFVKMSSEAEMNEAIANLDGQTLDGRTIRVNAAEERPRRNMY